MSADDTMRDWTKCECCGQTLPEDQRPMIWDPKADQDALCTCGHPYYRHFDTYDDMRPVGCKYCDCTVFSPMVAP